MGFKSPALEVEVVEGEKGINPVLGRRVNLGLVGFLLNDFRMEGLRLVKSDIKNK